MYRWNIITISILLLPFAINIRQPSFSQEDADNYQITDSDPAQESGFPVLGAQQRGGFTYWPESPSTIVANLDDDWKIEIAHGTVSHLSLHVWNSDSSLNRGWPARNYYFLAFPAAGNLQGNGDQLEIVSTFDYSYIVAYDKEGNPLPGWPKYILGWGHAAPALADVDSDGYDEIFVDLDNAKMYGLDQDGTDLPGWPVDFCCAQAAHTPAIADLDQDSDLEVVFATDPMSSGQNLWAYHHTGQPVSGFPFLFDGYASEFPVIGDVDGDGQPEIVFITSSSYQHFGLDIVSASGTLERRIELPGTMHYVAAPALADLDQDHVPEIIAGSDKTLTALKGTGSILPGWPVYLPLPPNYDFDDPYILVGDVNGDKKPDVITAAGDTYAFDRNGVLLPGFPKPGRAIAIADIDRDGRNEIITSNPALFPQEPFPYQVNVYDLGGTEHGAIEWGQFGGGPEHRHLYPVPPVPSPIQEHDYDNPIFLPIINIPVQTAPLRPGIYGRVTFNGVAESNVPLELRFFNGTSWSVQARATTAADGRYYFPNVPSLTTGQAYYVRYQNHAPGHLAVYASRFIYNYKIGSEVGITDFDLADFHLVEPEDGASVSLPSDFIGADRFTLPIDRYAFTLYDPQTENLYKQVYPYESASWGVLRYLPPGFTTGVPYYWSFWAISPENAIGIPMESRQVIFLNNPGPSQKPIEDEISPENMVLELSSTFVRCELLQASSGCNFSP